jgi:hypothetical protein
MRSAEMLETEGATFVGVPTERHHGVVEQQCLTGVRVKPLPKAAATVPACNILPCDTPTVAKQPTAGAQTASAMI